MLASLMMGLTNGGRAMTPPAAVAVAIARDGLPIDQRAPRLLSHPADPIVARAVGEMAGDKQKTTPGRIVAISVAAHFITSTIPGASTIERQTA